MFIQASIYNCSWLKPQWAKLLVLIVLIVPLLSIKENGNQEARTVNIDLHSLQEETIGSSNLNPFKRSGSLLFPMSVPQRRAPDKVSFTELSQEEHTGWALTAKEKRKQEESIARMDKLNILMEGENTPRRRARARELLHLNEDDRPYGRIDPEKFRVEAVDQIKDGHFKEVLFMMWSHQELFHHDYKDFAYSHAFVAQLAKMAKQSAANIARATEILQLSDCNEWRRKDFATKIEESCANLRKIKRVPNNAEAFDELVRMYDIRLYKCNKNHKDSIKECII